MSIVSSALSTTRLSGWRINVRFSSLMESIYAIGFGLGLRFVVDTVSHHDLKLTGIIVGLWEGIILLHFVKKMPKSSDPYIAYGVRLFIDFLYTESVSRFILIAIWTGLGLVLADIAPVIWDDVGLKRVWRRFRRDLYTITRRIPTVAFFPPPRTVRFSPSRQPSVITEAPTEVSLSNITPTQTPAASLIPLTSVAREILRRRVPGHFQTDFSDTETDPGSIRGRSSPLGTTHSRLALPRRRNSIDTATDISSTLSQNDVDEGNLSSSASSSTTELPEHSVDEEEMPVIDDEQEEEVVAAAGAAMKDEELELTPKQRYMYMPPTPSDTAPPMELPRERDEPLAARPQSAHLPQIPDLLEEPASDEWEKIQHADAIEEEKPPTPPVKDRFFVSHPNIDLPPSSVRSPPPPPHEDLTDWAGMESQLFQRPENGNAAAATHDPAHRTSLPPPYTNYMDDDDDMYYNGPDNGPATTTNENHDTSIILPVPEPGSQAFETAFGNSEGYWDFNAVSDADIKAQAEEQRQAEEAAEAQRLAEVWQKAQEEAAAAEAQRLADEAEAERMRQEAEATAERERQEAEAAAEREREEAAERQRQEEEEAERNWLEEERLRLEAEEKQKAEAEKQRKEDEKAARKKKEAEDEEARQKKREEDEKKRKADEEAEKQRKAEEEAEKQREEADKQRKKEEADKLKKQEEEAEKRREEEEAEKQKEQEEEAEKQRRKEEKRKRKEEEAEWKRQEGEKQQKEREEQNRKEEEERKQRETTDKARTEAEERQRKEEEENKRLEEAKREDQAREGQAKEEAARRVREGELERGRKKDEELEQRRMEAKEAEEQREKERQEAQELDAQMLRKRRASRESTMEAEVAKILGESRGKDEDETTQGEGGQRNQRLAGQQSVDDFFAQIAADIARQETKDGEPKEEANTNEQSTQPDLTNDAVTNPFQDQSAEEESVVSDAGGVPSPDVALRLDRMLILRAQMVVLEDKIVELTGQDDAASVQELKSIEKVMRKYQRQLERRYDAANGLAEYLNDFDKPGTTPLDTLNPQWAEQKIEEQMEFLLTPSSKSLNFTITFGKKPGDAKRQKPKVAALFHQYQLMPYTTEKGRTSTIKVPEEEFGKWLTAYRTKPAGEAEPDHIW